MENQAIPVLIRRGVVLLPLLPLQIQNNPLQRPQPPPLRVLSNEQARNNLLALINNPQ